MMEAQAATMSRMSVAQHSFPMQASALPRVTPMIALKNVLTMIFASVFAKPNNVIALSYALVNRIFVTFRTNSANSSSGLVVRAHTLLLTTNDD
jgi:hypothetical protein